jgi:hypothetical protein
VLIDLARRLESEGMAGAAIIAAVERRTRPSS